MASSEIPIVGPILSKVFGSRNERIVKRYTTRVDAIGALEPEMRKLTDDQLRGKLEEFRKRHDDGAKADDLLIEVFAAAREGMDRAVGIRNIFNPEQDFDPGVLNETGQRLYHEVKAKIDTLEPAEPEGPYLGHPEPIPPHLQVDIPVELYDAVREAYPDSKPPFRARPFDVQLIGGMVLGQGKIAEMKTGEGKTIVAPLATYMACVQRQQVHVVTVNDYLVQRDRDWTFPFFCWMGLTAGAIHPMHMQPEEVKRKMYRCDVVYGTTSEFGFDYLRDNMKRNVEQQVQRKRQFAIVDEVDSTLIDEARTPLIISGQAHDDQPRYQLADELARKLVDMQKPWQELEDQVTHCKETIKGLEGDIRQIRDKALLPELQKKLKDAEAALPEIESKRDQHTQYYELEMERKSAHLTHDGIAEAQKLAGVGSFYVDENMDIPHLLEQSLRAHAVYTRDKDYIVMDVPDRMSGRTEPTIVIVDTNTGRPMIGRQWSDGLHQAVECKEGVPIKPETQTVASVTVQNFFKMYKSLSGMTGTADTEAQEFHDIYSLDVVSIPTNKPIARADHDDLMFLRQKDKWEAIVDEIKEFHDAGRPILVGTTSVEKSEMISQMLTRKHHIEHSVLNAKQHEREANVVEDAGQIGAVMIATNMAGRGTDIKLGRFTREQFVEHLLRRGLASKGLTPDMSDEQLRENVYRKIAPSVLKSEGISKRDAESMSFDELELALLRHWAGEYTWLSPKGIEAASREELVQELDKNGRCLMHRLRWFDNIEDMGGLHVIGTERHESRRIDNQLRGRSGRQGDNGSSRFFVSLEDDLMKMFAGETTMKLLSRLGMKEGDAIEHPWLSKNVERAQKKVEERNFQQRKSILDYDEVMEHQRQRFYGLRQRVLEGQQVKDLIFEYIEDVVDDAIAEYLDSDFAAICAAEYAREKLDCSILPERLKGKDADQMEMTIRKLAKEDIAANITVTLGEYIPVDGSEFLMEFDSAGLHNWAKNRFGVELDTGDLREAGPGVRRQVQEQLEAAAFEKIDNTELDEIPLFADPNYGAERLSKWVKTKFTFDVSPEDIVHANRDDQLEVRDLIIDKARDLYTSREAEFPVEFIMQTTIANAQRDPNAAFEGLARWARNRAGIEVTVDEIKTTPPPKMRARLIEAMREQVKRDNLSEQVNAALATGSDDELDEYLKSQFDEGITERMRYLDEDDREDAIRARVETLARPELVQFEQMVLIETLDQSWKDHLYAMDQLRDSIGFRAIAQTDPKIEYKREGQRMFKSMMKELRQRVTDIIFKARIAPPRPQQPMQRPPQQRPAAPQQQRPQQRPQGAPTGNIMGSSIMGPGMSFGPARAATPPKSEPQTPPEPKQDDPSE
ncbi:MAG: preprotein translocase subunit SecA [Phycisphaerae bacterium]|nr:preprotein translocase subunit SecA [Phycisphaerae bacterium]MBM92986.1 preprotein translocase subunit SecA [Phycisphaerae bacterium]